MNLLVTGGGGKLPSAVPDKIVCKSEAVFCLAEIQRTAKTSGNLYGAPPLAAKEFVACRAQAECETTFGVGLAVDLPTGECLDDKLINLGWALTMGIPITGNFGANSPTLAPIPQRVWVPIPKLSPLVAP